MSEHWPIGCVCLTPDCWPALLSGKAGPGFPPLQTYGFHNGGHLAALCWQLGCCAAKPWLTL